MALLILLSGLYLVAISEWLLRVWQR